MLRWRVALVAWMGVIFLLSSSLLAPHMSAEGTEGLFGSLNYVARKCAHVADYYGLEKGAAMLYKGGLESGVDPA